MFLECLPLSTFLVALQVPGVLSPILSGVLLTPCSGDTGPVKDRGVALGSGRGGADVE